MANVNFLTNKISTSPPSHGGGKGPPPVRGVVRFGFDFWKFKKIKKMGCCIAGRSGCIGKLFSGRYVAKNGLSGNVTGISVMPVLWFQGTF